MSRRCPTLHRAVAIAAFAVMFDAAHGQATSAPASTQPGYDAGVATGFAGELRAAARYVEAVPHAERALHLTREAFGPNHEVTRLAAQRLRSIRHAAALPAPLQWVHAEAERVACCALALRQSGRWQAAVTAYLLAAAKYGQAGALYEAAQTTSFAAGTCMDGQELERADVLYDDSMLLYTAVDDAAGKGAIHHCRAVLARVRKRLDESAAQFALAEQHFAQANDVRNRYICRKNAEWDRELELANKLRAAREACNYREVCAIAAALLTHREMSRGPHHRLTQVARAELRRAEIVAAAGEDVQRAQSRADARFAAGMDALSRREFAAAAGGMAEAARAATEAGDTLLASRAALLAETARLYLGQLDAAEQRLPALLAALEQIDFDPDLAPAYEARGFARAGRRRVQDALTDFRSAAESYDRMGMPVAAGYMHASMADCYAALGREPEAVEALMEAMTRFAEGVDETVYTLMTRCAASGELSTRAWELCNEKKHAEAETYIRTALARADVQQDAETLLDLSEALGFIHQARGERVAALRVLAHRIRVARACFEIAGSDDSRLGMLLASAAHDQFSAQRYGRAREFFERAARVLETSDDCTSLAAIHWCIGDTCLRLDRTDDAVEAYDRAIDARMRASGAESPELLRDLEDIGVALQGWDDPATRRVLGRAAALRRKLGVTEPDVAGTAEHFGQAATVFRLLNLPRDARDYGERAIAMFERLKIGDDLRYANALLDAAFGHTLTGNVVLTLDRLDRAVPMLRRLGQDSWSADAPILCAFALVMNGRPAEALERLDAMLSAPRAADEEGAVRYAVGLTVSGMAITMLGRPDDARERYGRALAVEELTFMQRTALRALTACMEAGISNDPESMRTYLAAAGSVQILNPAAGPLMSGAIGTQAVWLLIDGKYAEALEQIDAALRAGPELERDYPLQLAMMQLAKAEIVLGLGDRAQAAALLEQSRSEIERTGSALFLAALQRIAGLVALADGRIEAALRLLDESITLLEEVRGSNAGVSEAERGNLLSALHMNRWYESMIRAQLAAGRPADALRYVERGRARGLLDLLERSRFDPLREMRDRAALQQNQTLLERIARLEHDLAAARDSVASVEHEIAARRGLPADGDAGQATRETELDRLFEKQRLAREREQAANREWFKLVRDELPLSQSRDAAQIQRMLSASEYLLVYSVTREDATLFVVPAAGGEVRAIPLTWPDGEAVTRDTLEAAVDIHVDALRNGGRRAQRAALAAEVATLEQRGDRDEPAEAALVDLRAKLSELDRSLTRNPGDASATQPVDSTAVGARLMQAVMPADIWALVKGAPRVYVVPHGALHRVPFETLVIDIGAAADGSAAATDASTHDLIRYWLDEGPPIVYGSSGSALLLAHERRDQQLAVRGSGPRFEAVAVGDPVFSRDPAASATAKLPEAGAYVLSVPAIGAAVGLAPGDVILRYDGHAIADHAALATATFTTKRAIEDGAHADEPVEMTVWRGGSERTLRVPAGELGVKVARVSPAEARKALEAGAAADSKRLAVERGAATTRYGGLEPLHGTRREVESIYRTLSGRDDAGVDPALATAQPNALPDGAVAVRALLGDDATESDVFALAPQCRYLHFATHQIVDERQFASYSRLALTLPRVASAVDNGFLTLQELLDGWRNHLRDCELVVLSACETQIGREQQDDAVFAMPIGFQYAGAPAVIASLWRVNDDSTAELMSDFYARLKRDGSDKLAAFNAARKALRERFPEPYFWAPFIYLGDPR